MTSLKIMEDDFKKIDLKVEKLLREKYSTTEVIPKKLLTGYKKEFYKVMVEGEWKV